MGKTVAIIAALDTKGIEAGLIETPVTLAAGESWAGTQIVQT